VTASSHRGTAERQDRGEALRLIWNALFGKIDPLDEQELGDIFRDCLPANLPLHAMADQGAVDGA